MKPTRDIGDGLAVELNPAVNLYAVARVFHKGRSIGLVFPEAKGKQPTYTHFRWGRSLGGGHVEYPSIEAAARGLLGCIEEGREGY